MLSNIRSTSIPGNLRGPVLIDETGLPRFWALVWSSFLPQDLAQSSLVMKLRPIDSFYSFADGLGGPGSLDEALAKVDLEVLSRALEGYFFLLKDTRVPSANAQMRWHTVLGFTRDILTRITKGADSNARLHDLNAKLTRVEMLYSQLRVHRRRKASPIRALPASVVDALYDMLDPASPTNPFTDGASRWRVYVVFIALLHFGIRRGELLILPADAVKSGQSMPDKRLMYWLNVVDKEYEEDPPLLEAQHQESSINKANSGQ